MTAHQTKFFKLKEVSFPILLWIVGVSVALVLHVFGVFSHAKPIENEDKVTVDGVENVVQYLTSLVLHAPWTSSQLITIQYDGGIDALRVNGRVNADALVIDAGQVNNNSSVEGNAVFWWMWNRVDGQTSNNLIVGWENNTINFARLNGAIPGRFWVSQGGGSVVIGSAKSEIRTSDNVLNIGTTNSSFSNKTRNVAAIGWQVVAQDVENSVAFWAGKKTFASNSILLGKSINAGGKNQIFVWSDSDEEFAPEHSNAFYVNAANGFGLNTTAPRTKLDLGNVGVLRIAKTEPKNCSQSSAGVTSYAGSVFCGCDGKEWIPLTSDMTPEKVAACKTLGKVKCIGTINTDSNATNMWESSAYSRWNHESDKREPMGWKYSSKDKLGACEYNCKIWFHPGANDPEGWLQVWACKACSEVVNKFRWKTAGTGNDNCDFTCKASFKYVNTSLERKCSDCEVGTYTENDNQDKVCKNCNAPERLSTGTISPSLWTHYYTFDTKGTGKNACDFTCDARYAYFFNGKGKHDSRDSLSADLGSQALDLGISVGRGEGWKGGIGTNPLPGQGTPLKKDWVKMWTSFFPVSYNACVYCKVGTWSAGWKSKECTNCTNKQENIDYWVDNVKGTLSDFSTYIGNGSANDCDWKCDANKGLEKHGDICKCRANTHLEWGTCIANSSNGQCNLRRQPSGNWVKIWATTYSRIWNPDLDNPNYKGTWSAPATKSWVYVENATSLSPCQWSCATGYEPSGNTCVKKAVAVTGACAQNVTVPVDGTKLVGYAQANSSLFCSPGTLINPPVILNGKLEWKCAWLNGWKPSPTCRVSCPANYTLQNGACVKSASQYEWKCIEVNKEGYCDLPMENKDIRNWSGFQNENGPDWHYDTAHKWCFFSTREDCEKHECEWRSGGNPLSLGKIPVCADKSAPNDRSKDSKNRKADCKVPIPDCGSKVPQPGCESEDHTTVDIGFPRQVNFVNCRTYGAKCDSEGERQKYITDEMAYYYFILRWWEKILYVPINYYVDHPDGGVKWVLEINADIWNSAATDRETFWIYQITTNKNSSFIEIPFDDQVSKGGWTHYKNLPCSFTSESIWGCHIRINSAKLKLPTILNKDPRCRNCILKYGVKTCKPKPSLWLSYGSTLLKWFYCPYRTVAGKKNLDCPVFKIEKSTNWREILDWNRLSVAKNKGINNRWNKPLWISLNASGSPEFKGMWQDFWDDTLSQNVCLKNDRNWLGKCIPVMERALLLPWQNWYSPFQINLDLGNGNHYRTSIDLNHRFKEIKGITNENGEIFKDWYSNMERLHEANGWSLCRSSEGGPCISELEWIDCDFVGIYGNYESECKAMDPTSCRNSRFCEISLKK